jgi:hypothetical protein
MRPGHRHCSLAPFGLACGVGSQLLRSSPCKHTHRTNLLNYIKEMPFLGLFDDIKGTTKYACGSVCHHSCSQPQTAWPGPEPFPTFHTSLTRHMLLSWAVCRFEASGMTIADHWLWVVFDNLHALGEQQGALCVSPRAGNERPCYLLPPAGQPGADRSCQTCPRHSGSEPPE